MDEIMTKEKKPCITIGNDETETPLQDWMKLKDFCKKYSFITLASLRWILHNSEFNGSEYFVRKLGMGKTGALLISPTLFFSWLESNKTTETKKEKQTPHL